MAAARYRGPEDGTLDSRLRDAGLGRGVSELCIMYSLIVIVSPGWLRPHFKFTILHSNCFTAALLLSPPDWSLTPLTRDLPYRSVLLLGPSWGGWLSTSPSQF